VLRYLQRQVAMGSNALKTPRRGKATPRGKKQESAPKISGLTLRDLGWSREQAKAVRAKLSSFAVDWDDTRMDVYNAP